MTQTVGQVNTTIKTRKITGVDPWTDSPFFAPGMETDSEHMLAWPVGEKKGGYFHGLREAKTQGVGEKSYAVFTDSNGVNFKVRAPGKLRYELGKEIIKDGMYVVMTYLGKTFSESLQKDVHDFDVEIADQANLQ